MSEFSATNNFNTYTTYGQVLYQTNFTEESNNANTNGQTFTFLSDADDKSTTKKLIPVNIVTLPGDVNVQPTNFLVNYGLQRIQDVVPSGNQACTTVTSIKPINTIITSIASASTPDPNNIPPPRINQINPNTILQSTSKKKPKPKNTDNNVKVKIEMINRAKKGRKQKIPGQTREERKHKANTNKPYINSKGVEVQPRVFDEDFACGCPKRCCEKVTVQARRGIFNMFWKMGSFEGRCCFINSCVNESPKKRQTTKEPNKRKNSRKYYLKGQEVCKKTFCNTLKISGRTVDGSLLKAQMDDFTDLRGKAKKPNALSTEKIQEVIDHVNSFPTTGRHLVDSSLTLKKMYELYKISRENPVSESSYKNIFYRHFKLRFEKIKKDSGS